jgi:hypothetical protein
MDSYWVVNVAVKAPSMVWLDVVAMVMTPVLLFLMRNSRPGMDAAVGSVTVNAPDVHSMA